MIGICLNRLLLPVLRDFVAQEIPKHYASLKTAHGIDTQVYGKHSVHDGPFQLNYGSINNNWWNFKKKVRSYDYKVGTAEDLAKLYLEPHMARFTGTQNKSVPNDLSFKQIMYANQFSCFKRTVAKTRSSLFGNITNSFQY